MIVSTEGDLGDSIALLGILHELNGGPHTLLLEKGHQTKYQTNESIVSMEALLKPLADIQPYIQECRRANPGEPIDWKSAGFRSAWFQPGNTLMAAAVDHLIRTKQTGHGILGLNPWLFNVEPSGETADRIVINRTGRWRNGSFPWADVVKHYHWRLLFIGLPHEHREFCGHYGYVDFRPVSNLLEFAELIAGSLLFIGNQSCANWLCEGLKHPLIQETCQGTPDCIYVRPNAQHVWNGSLTLPGFDGDPDIHINPIRDISKISVDQGAPGGWQYPCPPIVDKATGRRGRPEIMALNHDHCFKQVRRRPEFKGASDADVRRAIIEATLERLPDWQTNNQHLHFVQTAIQRSEALVHRITQARQAPTQSQPMLVPHS